MFPKAQRVYNTSHLHPDVCDQAHFMIRLVQADHVTEDIVWGAVVGLGESFTLVELLSFPVYVLANHGDTWNGDGWTWWVTLFVFAPLLILCVRLTLKALKVRVLELVFVEDTKIVWFFDDYREILYELGILGFTASGFEMIIHLFIAAQGISDTRGFFVGLGVATVPNGLGIALCLFNWSQLRYRIKLEQDADNWSRSRRWSKRCSYSCYKCSGSAWWSFVEIFTGLTFFLLFGAGFYIGPSCVTLAGILRLRDLRYTGRFARQVTGFKRPDLPPPLVARASKPEVPPADSTGVHAESQSLVPGLYLRPV